MGYWASAKPSPGKTGPVVGVGSRFSPIRIMALGSGRFRKGKSKPKSPGRAGFLDFRSADCLEYQAMSEHANAEGSSIYSAGSILYSSHYIAFASRTLGLERHPITPVEGALLAWDSLASNPGSSVAVTELAELYPGAMQNNLRLIDHPC